METGLHRLARRAASRFCATCAIVRLAGEGAAPEVVALCFPESRDPDDDRLERALCALASPKLEGLLALAMRGTLVLEDVDRTSTHPDEDPGVPEGLIALARDLDVRSLMLVPLHAGDGPWGLAFLARRGESFRAFDAAEIAATAWLADLFAAETARAAATAAAERADVALREARAAERLFRGFVEAAPDAMVVVDARGEVVLVNAQTESLFGFSRADLLGKPIEILVPRRHRPDHAKHRDGYLGAPKVRAMGTGLELHGQRQDGSEFPIEISLSPLETAEGLFVSAAIRDVTRRNAVEAALKISNRELEAFSYSVAHDLRAPLRAMNGFAQILHEEYQAVLDAEGVDCLDEIRDNAQRMGGLIDALLSLSRVTRSELRPDHVDLSAIARACGARLSAADPERRVEVVVEEGLTAYLDAPLGRNLVENLLGNAWKFSAHREKTTIEVGSVPDQEVPTFFVRDHGAGFDMAHAGKLFTPFQRLHTVSEYPGTGIGLATVQRIVHRHGGRVWAEGEVGRGATFFFTLAPAPMGAS